MLSIEEFKHILENHKVHVQEENLAFLHEFTNILSEKILDDWIDKEFNIPKNDRID